MQGRSLCLRENLLHNLFKCHNRLCSVDYFEIEFLVLLGLIIISIIFFVVCLSSILYVLLIVYVFPWHSSVTAGHDSLFNASFPVIVGELMRPALSLLDVELDSRNVALGNNPCTPYDVCVKYFAGLDADVVHWEQTFFC